jgi:putative hemolysin
VPRRRSQRPANANGGLRVVWARHQDEVRAAQRLRFEVFAGEMGARLATPLARHDIDLFDEFCEHLLVRDAWTDEVVGTCRLLTPAQARRVGSSYFTDLGFDLTRLRDLRPRMVELGRGCVHPAHRHGMVLPALWTALSEFMRREAFDTLVGCAPIPMRQPDTPFGATAASIWRQLSATHLAPVRYQVQPRRPLPLGRFDATLRIEPPTVIKACLRMGATLLGPPAWDSNTQSADLPLLLRIRR